MTWEDLMAEISALSPSEQQRKVLIFDHNEGVYLKVRALITEPDPDEPDDPIHLTVES
jgi:hypothetical protein